MLSRIRVQAPHGGASITLLKTRKPRTVDCYDLLVEAICHQASKDLRGRNFKQKIDAMDFFRSWWFEFMSGGLDGEMVIQRLLRRDE